MLICPKCKTEYRDGFTTCADCGASLEEHAAIINETAQSSKNERKAAESGWQPADERFLANFNEVVELSYVTSMLDDARIPYRIIAKDVSDYLQIMHGSSYLGSCLYVNAKDYEAAREIIDSLKAPVVPEDELAPEEKSFSSIKKHIAQGAFLLFLIILFILIYRYLALIL